MRMTRSRAKTGEEAMNGRQGGHAKLALEAGGLPHIANGAGVVEPELRWRLILRRIGRGGVVTGLAIITWSALFPLIFMIDVTFRTQSDWEHSELGWPTTWPTQAFEGAWVQGDVGLFFRNSMIITVGSVALSLILASMAGYSFGRLRWRGQWGTYVFLLLWMAVPPLFLMVPIYVEMTRLHLLNTYASVILLYAAINVPFNTYLMTTYFRMLPGELMDAAKVDGAGIHRLFLRVMLPMSMPVLATLCIFDFLYVWNEFLFALLLLSNNNIKTLTVGILQLTGGRIVTDYPILMAALLIASAPVIGIYVFFQKYLVRAIVAGAVK
jgi:raffinose/stachyose/melibiose transport system permease protein